MAKKKSSGILDSISDFLEDAFKGATQGEPDVPAGGAPEPVTRRVSLIIHNPRVPGANNERLNKVLAWNDPRPLLKGYMDDLRECSRGYVNYDIVERHTVDGFPRKADGFVYTADAFVDAWRKRQGFHQPDAVDYDALIEEFDMIAKVNSGAVDEFWLFAFPYAGYYESIMGGPGAFWCNAPPLTQTAHAARRFVIMKYAFREKRGNDNLWERFFRHEFKNPGQAEVGWMHYAPNSERDYDWGNKRQVLSRWRTWQNFPDLRGEAQMVDCNDWGNGDIRLHHKWWFNLLPHINGAADGIAHHWWKYIVDPHTVTW